MQLPSGKIPLQDQRRGHGVHLLPVVFHPFSGGVKNPVGLDGGASFIPQNRRQAGGLLQQGGEVLLHAISWLLMIIYLLFILIDYPIFTNGLKLIVPGKYRRKFMEIATNVADGMNHYFRGQGIVALYAIVLYTIGFYLAGLPLWFPMAVLVGVLYMIPYFQYVTIIPVALL